MQVTLHTIRGNTMFIDAYWQAKLVNKGLIKPQQNSLKQFLQMF